MHSSFILHNKWQATSLNTSNVHESISITKWLNKTQEIYQFQQLAPNQQITACFTPDLMKCIHCASPNNICILQKKYWSRKHNMFKQIKHNCNTKHNTAEWQNTGWWIISGTYGTYALHRSSYQTVLETISFSMSSSSLTRSRRGP